MSHSSLPPYIAFNGARRVAAGLLPQVVRHAKQALDADALASIHIFDGRTSASIEIDFRGDVEAVLQRLPPAPLEVPPADEAGPSVATRPGRPKLGVVAREVTLLPRHWSWLNEQPGGASVALRKLVEEARRASESRDRTRQAQESAYRFMLAMAGDEAGFEEATRALFAGDGPQFARCIAQWPSDVGEHAHALAQVVFDATAQLQSTPLAADKPG